MVGDGKNPTAMQIKNTSTYPTHILKPLIDFIRSRVPIADLARLEIMSGARQGTGGLAYKFHPKVPSDLEPSLVQIWARPQRQFRVHQEQHVPELEPIELYSWQEEFILVLAHELRHVAQFWDINRDWTPDRHQMEVDAEVFAIQTLDAWRLQQRVAA